MPRYIDTEKLLKVPNVRNVCEYDETGEFISYKAVPVEAIENAPTIEAEPVRHGKWEKICTSYWRWKPDGAHVVNRFKYKHNECGKVVAKAELYCPKCGAKMDALNVHNKKDYGEEVRHD